VYPKELTVKTSIEKYLKGYNKEQGTDLRQGVRDVLTDCVHICRQHNIEFSGVLQDAKDVALEELQQKIWDLDPRMIPTILPLEKLGETERALLEQEFRDSKGDA